MIATSPRISITGNPSKNSTVEEPRVAPTSRLAGPLRSQDRPRIGRGDRDVARVRGAHTRKTMYAPPAREGDCHGRLVAANTSVFRGSDSPDYVWSASAHRQSCTGPPSALHVDAGKGETPPLARRHVNRRRPAHSGAHSSTGDIPHFDFLLDAILGWRISNRQSRLQEARHRND